jgi:hypothetical protein
MATKLKDIPFEIMVPTVVADGSPFAPAGMLGCGNMLVTGAQRLVMTDYSGCHQSVVYWDNDHRTWVFCGQSDEAVCAMYAVGAMQATCADSADEASIAMCAANALYAMCACSADYAGTAGHACSADTAGHACSADAAGCACWACSADTAGWAYHSQMAGSLTNDSMDTGIFFRYDGCGGLDISIDGCFGHLRPVAVACLSDMDPSIRLLYIETCV